MKKYSDIVNAIEKIDKEHSFANIFEVIKSYKNLVGHYQRSSNNFPLDFSSFPAS